MRDSAASVSMVNRPVGGPTYAAFREKMAGRLGRFEEGLLAELGRYRGSIFYEPVLYALKGGKRIRPLLLILASECVGGGDGGGGDPGPMAVAVELMHTESLIHDDIIDRSATRRRRPSFHARYGHTMALLSADFILAIVLDIIARCGNPRVAGELAAASVRMCEGEVEEAGHAGAAELSWNAYVGAIEKKTASLFEVSTRVGAILGGGDEVGVQALAEYGRLFGVAYQILDDVADWRKRGGPPISLNPTGRGEGLAYLMGAALSYAERSKKKLGPLPEGEAKQHLAELAGSVHHWLV